MKLAKKAVSDHVRLKVARGKIEAQAQTIDNLTERLREYQARQTFLDKAAGYAKTPRIIAREKSSKVRECTAVALASDWHVEEPVAPEAVAGRNEYNLAIADKRIKRFFRSVIWSIQHHTADASIRIRSLVLWKGGDLISGFIHPELMETNELSPTLAISWLLPRIRNGIQTLLEALPDLEIVIPCSYGNHGRTTDYTRVSTGYANSFEWLMYNILRDDFREESRIRFEITASAHQYVEVYDKVIHFHHGDSVKYAGGVGGISVPLLRAKPGWDMVRRADVSCVGHFHQYSDFGRVVVNGSLIGFGPYSLHIRAQYEPPQQAFFLIDSKRGKCQSTPLWVGEGA